MEIFIVPALWIILVGIPLGGVVLTLVLTSWTRTRRIGIYVLASGLLGAVSIFLLEALHEYTNLSNSPAASSEATSDLGQIAFYGLIGFCVASLAAIVIGVTGILLSRLWSLIARTSK